MATKVQMRNPRTGETKHLKVGFSWILLFFSGFFGIPLFLRSLYTWAAIMLGLYAVQIVGGSFVDPQTATQLLLAISAIQIGFAIFLGIKGNELTGKNYLERGWEWANPDDRTTVEARQAWSLA